MIKLIFLGVIFCLTELICTAHITLHNTTPHIVGLLIKNREHSEEEILLRSQETVTLEEHVNPCTLSLYTSQEKNIFSFELPSDATYLCKDNTCSMHDNTFTIKVSNNTKIVLKSAEGDIVAPVEHKPDSAIILKSVPYVHGVQLSNIGTLKKALKAYYQEGLYEKDLEDICAKAHELFSASPVQDNDVIIFDIDDTALISYVERDDFSFLWDSKKAFNEFRAQRLWTANKAVLELYHNVLNQGYKVIFMSARLHEDYDTIKARLNNAGYTTFEALILKEDKAQATEIWKQGKRKELAKTYRIVGSIGDRYKDFVGDPTGIKACLPNFLYD